MGDRSAQRVVDAWTERLKPALTERALAWWAVNTDASSANAERYRRSLLAFEEKASDPEGFTRVVRSLEEPVSDALLSRTLVVLRNLLTPYQAPKEIRRAIVDLESAVQERYSNVRGTIGGEPAPDNRIGEVLKSSEDAALREEAWRASKAVGAAVGADVRRLAKERNRAARSLGFADHYALELSLQEVDPSWLDAFLSRMGAATERPFSSYKGSLDRRLAARFRIDPDDVRPWHYEDPFFQEAPEAGRKSFDPLFRDADLVALVERTYEPLGFDLGPVLERSDLLARPGKCQHAFCTHVDRMGDVRVLSNNVSNERWAGTMLHEFGHAVYDRSIDPALPFLLREPPHASSTEAIAMLFGRLSKDPAWLVPVLGLSPAQAKEVAEAAAPAFREGMLVLVRWVLVMTRFERAMYADPDRDLDGLWWDLVERFQGVRRPEGRRAPDWAAKIHVALAPVYYHAYLMGECTASQISRHLRASVEGGGLVGNAAAGGWLRDSFFAPGNRRSWNEHLAAATGSALDPAVFLEEIQVAPSGARRE